MLTRHFNVAGSLPARFNTSLMTSRDGLAKTLLASTYLFRSLVTGLECGTAADTAHIASTTLQVSAGLGVRGSNCGGGFVSSTALSLS